MEETEKCKRCNGSGKIKGVAKTVCENGCCSAEGDIRPLRREGCNALLGRVVDWIKCPDCKGEGYKITFRSG